MKNSIPVRTFINDGLVRNIEIMTIQIMEDRYKSDFMKNFNVLGNITFQKGKDETEWYAMHYKTDTTDFRELNEFHKIARKIYTTFGTNCQPKDIIELINGVEYNVQNGEWFCKADTGQYCFDLNYDCDTQLHKTGLYARLMAKNLVDAEKKLKNIIAKNSNDLTKYNLTITEKFKII